MLLIHRKSVKGFENGLRERRTEENSAPNIPGYCQGGCVLGGLME